MLISLNSSLLTGGKLAWEEKVRLAARVGYPAIDVSNGPAMAAGVAEAKALLEHVQVKPGVCDFPVDFSHDDAAFERTFGRLEPAAQFAAAIGCPRMATWIMSSSKMPKAELRAILLKRFRACAGVMARSHVALGLEFLGPLHIRRAFPNEFIWRMNEMVDFAKECGPNVGLLLDVWHWHHAGATTDDILAAGKQRIVHVHVSDSKDLPPEDVRDNERILPGEGVINLTGFFRALQKAGYSDAVSVEVISPRWKDVPPEEAARLGLESTRKVMEKAGVPWNA